jgi:murein DD-endopeptidase MepM/ murein hydrolase activator NlpD
MVSKIITLFLIVLVLVGIVLLPNVRAKIHTTIEAIKVPFKIARLYKISPDATIFMPVIGARVRDIGDTWQAPRSGGRSHEGQDIFAKRGTPVQSAVNGYVMRVGDNSLGGKVVWMVGAGGRRYYYAHLDSFGPHAITGKEVSTSSIIGYVGATGNASGTPPHLHFGVYGNGGALDPLELLEDRI